jgi:hypothetical protein
MMRGFGLFGALGRLSIRDIEGSQETVSFTVDILISELVHGSSSRSFHQLLMVRFPISANYSIPSDSSVQRLGSLEISLCGAADGIIT